MILGLGHQAQVGKDTAAEILVRRYGFTRLAFADILKRVAADANPPIPAGYEARPVVGLRDLVHDIGWESAKRIPEVRAFLQDLGVAARDHLDPDVWVRPVIARALTLDDVVITDVRFPNEFQAIRSAGGTLVKMTRQGAGAGGHVSEIALADADWDHVISNDGTLAELEVALLEVTR